MPDTTIGRASYFRIARLIFHAASAALLRITTYPLRTTRASTLYKDALNAAVRSMLNHLTIADARFLSPPTTKSYEELYCKPRSLDPAALTLKLETEHGSAVAHWMGDPGAESVVLYCHGGGYTQPANRGNFRHLPSLIEELNAGDGRSVAVLMLAYSLVPEEVYPVQLREAAVVLDYLIRDTGRDPSRIFLAGDSAGGNLALGLLSHVLHPHPDVFELKLQRPLGGALLISPWVGFRTNYPSFRSNAMLDLLSPLALRKWSAMFLGKANTSNPESDPGDVTGDSWTEACLNPASWWSGMHHMVSSIFIWRGGSEVFVDSIRQLETNFKAGWIDGGGDISRAVFLESEGEAHVAPIVDTMVPGAGKRNAQAAIEDWFKNRLRE